MTGGEYALTAHIGLYPVQDGAYPYLYWVGDEDDSVTAGYCGVASEDSVEWERQADIFLATQGFERTGPWTRQDDATMVAPVKDGV